MHSDAIHHELSMDSRKRKCADAGIDALTSNVEEASKWSPWERKSWMMAAFEVDDVDVDDDENDNENIY